VSRYSSSVRTLADVSASRTRQRSKSYHCFVEVSPYTGIEAALKSLKRAINDVGLRTTRNRVQIPTRSGRNKFKQVLSRKRRARAARKHQAYLDLLGLDDRPRRRVAA
jgi:ribosomal protein S21